MDKEDQPIAAVHPHPIEILAFYFFGVVFIIAGFIFFWPGIVLGILIIVAGEISRRAETFYIMDSGVAREYKLLSTARKFIEYDKIQDIETDQGILQKIFGIGDINFDTAGTDQIEIIFHNVKSPYNLESIIREKMKKS